MDINKRLDEIEDRYPIDEIEDKKPALIEELLSLHMETVSDPDLLNRFSVLSGERFGGIYIPYLFWVKLADYLENPLDRAFLFSLLKAFASSNFGEEEQKMLKPLIITYFTNEKGFEINKLKTLIFDKAHPEVKEYFYGLVNFVEKNKKSTDMYREKFDLLKDLQPDFELMRLPITQLREQVS